MLVSSPEPEVGELLTSSEGSCTKLPWDGTGSNQPESLLSKFPLVTRF
jgi:hypothetical protein